MKTCRREFSRAARAGHQRPFNRHRSFQEIQLRPRCRQYGVRAVGNCLENLFRNEDIPCRFGGEEFDVIMPGAATRSA